MRENSAVAKARFAEARVARLATVGADGRPRLVPITFAVTGTAICSAVDAKPKRTRALRRLADIAAHSEVSVLVDHYDEDWTRLWWARADGRARVLTADGADRELFDAALAALCARYEQYRTAAPAGPVILIEVARWSAWAAAGEDH